MEPPISLAFQKDGVRRLIIASYLATILLAVPIWWSLTSIERLSLPTTRVNVQADHKVRGYYAVHNVPI
jgi:GPI-anchor transamidase subunit S